MLKRFFETDKNREQIKFTNKDIFMNCPSTSSPACDTIQTVSHLGKVIAIEWKKIHDKIQEILNRLAFGNQFAQLETMKKTHPRLAAAKLGSLQEYIKSVSTFDKLHLALKLSIEKINTLRTWLLRFWIHPATHAFTFEDTRSSYPDTPFISNGGFIQVYSKDHQQLDGMVVYGDNKKDPTKPVLVMCLGNMMRYEDFIYQAKYIAMQAHVNVVLYNPRGVGLSLGEEFTLDEAVEDCKTFIQYAQNNLCGGEAGKIAVLGISLGGGIATEALKQLQEEKPPLGKIAHYINVNSFPSLPKCAEGVMGLNSKLGNLALGLIGLNPLNSGRTLAARKLAKITTVITAEQDEVMRGPGRLSHYLHTVLVSKPPRQELLPKI